MTQLSIPCTAQGLAIPHRIFQQCIATPSSASVAVRVKRPGRRLHLRRHRPCPKKRQRVYHIGHGWTWGVLERQVANYMSPTVMAIGSEDTQLRLTQILIIFRFHLSVGFNLNHQQLPWLSTPQCRCTTDEGPHTVQAQDSLSEPR